MEPGEHADAAEAAAGRPLDGVRILALEQMQALPYANPFFFINLNLVFCKSLFFLFLLADAGTINLHGQIR